jgi:predicted MFS family arabinose efflux permease
VPPDLFASRQFTTANLVTFAVYGALGTAFFLLVLQLQVVSGFDPLVAGTALLPVTVMMLTLSARSSALAERIGPRLQLSTGPAIAAAGLLLTLRIGPAASYWLDVVPATLLFGLGLATLVAPLTATVLAAAPAEHVGVASGVNNAVARAAGLLAVALVPTLAGLDGADYRSAATFDAGFRNAIALCSGLLLVGALIGAVGITNRPPAAARAGTAEPESTQARPATDGSAPARSYSCPLDSPHAESRGL